jgi:hypothetical protein
VLLFKSTAVVIGNVCTGAVRSMKFALILAAMCSQHCVHSAAPPEIKLYSSFHACWVALVPKIYYGASGKWKCVQRVDSDSAEPKRSLPALASLSSTPEVGQLLQMESGGHANLVNRFGYAGLFQFGAPLLADLGLYTPGPAEDLSNWSRSGKAAPAKWSGIFDIPGFPAIRSLSDFLDSRAAQFAAFTLHRAKMEQQIAKRGLDGYLDHKIAGTTITRTGLIYMIHLGGAGGAQRVLQTEGRSNPRDANGTSLLDYARLGATPHGRMAEPSEEVAAP